MNYLIIEIVYLQLFTKLFYGVFYLVCLYGVKKLHFNKIDKVLKEQGRSQVWLAERMGITQSAINALCRNRSQPSIKKLCLIAHYLGVTPCALIEWPVEGLLEEMEGVKVEE